MNCPWKWSRSRARESDIKEVTRVIGYVAGLAGNSDDFKPQATAINAAMAARLPASRSSLPRLRSACSFARGLMKKVVTVKPILGDDLASGYEVGTAKETP